MNRPRKFRLNNGLRGGLLLHAKAFVFFSKETGTPRFQVSAAQDGTLPMDQAAYLLALHCVAGQQEPRDFRVMIAIDDDLVADLTARTAKLIRTCAGPVAPRTNIPRREQQVLVAITNGLSNKEIGSKLNITERTVKFHVSNLLRRFGVPTRVSLMHKVATLVMFQSEMSDRGAGASPSFQEYDNDLTQTPSRSRSPFVMPVQKQTGG